MSWKTLKTYPTQHEAHLIGGLLQSEGIEVHISFSALDELYPGTSIGNGHSVEVQEDDVEKALEILRNNDPQD